MRNGDVIVGPNKRICSERFCLGLCPVPSAVTGLQVEELHSTHSLQVSWKEALGVADGYVLQLLDDRGSLVTNISRAFGETRHWFEGLTAGRKYRVQVQTSSGGVHSQRVSTEARTCETPGPQLVQ